MKKKKDKSKERKISSLDSEEKIEKKKEENENNLNLMNGINYLAGRLADKSSVFMDDPVTYQEWIKRALEKSKK